MRIKLIVSYDGTDFCGWAAQKGHRTVQGTLTEALHRVVGEEIEVTGASRTDSGAHAKGQVCHFDTALPIVPGKWARILNRILPTDLAVIRSSPVSPNFNSRFCAEDRWYRYRIQTAARNPFVSRYAHDHGRDLDLEAMSRAGGLLEGRHDYRAFTEELQPHIDNTVRTMRRVTVSKRASEVWIEIGGTAFLRGMMRRMSGALLEVGAGLRKVETVAELLSADRDRMHWPVVLPAKGLCLMKVRYANPPIDHRSDPEGE